jgi:hypothetical protein
MEAVHPNGARERLLTDKLLLRNVVSKMESCDKPKRCKERIEKELPICKLSRTEKQMPAHLALTKTESEEPKRIVLRSDKPEPSCIKSRTDPRLPNRVTLRTDNAEPIAVESSSEVRSASRAVDKTEQLLPQRPKQRTLNVLPTFRSCKTLARLPKRT